MKDGDLIHAGGRAIGIVVKFWLKNSQTIDDTWTRKHVLIYWLHTDRCLSMSANIMRRYVVKTR